MQSFLRVLGIGAVLVAAVLLLSRWLASPSPSGPEAESADSLDEYAPELEALGYAVWEPAEEDAPRGVVVHDRERAWPGYNLYTSVAEAYLVDMSGRRVHSWRRPVSEDASGSVAVPVPRAKWAHVEPVPGSDGAILVAVSDEAVMKLAWDSSLVWATSLRAHHDIAVDDEGNIFALHRRGEIVGLGHGRLPMLVDRIAKLAPDGRVLRDLSLLPALGPHVTPERLARLARWEGRSAALSGLESRVSPGAVVVAKDTPADVFHTNSIEVLDRDLDFGRRGDLLLSVRELDRVAVLDPESGGLRWIHKAGARARQHQATLLPNGHLLFFDNSPYRQSSLVVEIDPPTRQRVWQYPSERQPDFFSRWGSGAETLPNGNLLVTETSKGRVFEITREGDVVWDYWNPSFRERERKRETIYRCTRLSDPERFPFLRRLPPP